MSTKINHRNPTSTIQKKKKRKKRREDEVFFFFLSFRSGVLLLLSIFFLQYQLKFVFSFPIDLVPWLVLRQQNLVVHLKMGSEDFIDLQAFGVSEDGNEDDGLNNSNSEPSEADGQPGTSQVIDGIPNGENLGQSDGVCVSEDEQHSEDINLEEDVIQDRPTLQDSIELAATITTKEKINGVKSESDTENICPVTQDDGTINTDQRDGGSMLKLIVPYLLNSLTIYIFFQFQVEYVLSVNS